MKQKYFLIVILFLFTKPLFAQDQYIGEIRLFTGNFAPRDWVLCDGQILSIVNYPNLFSIIGFRYGGNGTTTFAVPNLNDKVVLGAGQGDGLTDRPLASTGGAEYVTLTTDNMAPHNHAGNLKMSKDEATSVTAGPDKYLAATNNVFNGNTRTVLNYTATNSNDVELSLSAATTTTTGNSNPDAINVKQPTISMRYIIAFLGNYPLRP